MTLREAQERLPELGALLARAREEAQAAGGLEAEMQALAQRILLVGGLHVDVTAAAHRRALRDKGVEQVRAAIAQIEQKGARVADLGQGTLEIPCRAGGRDVLLCWTEGEPAIERWREHEDGSSIWPLSKGPFGGERLH